MAYAARVLQILVASPGDVQEEREILSQVIYEWNYTNSRERSIVLLPIRWETHASPEMSSSPQAVINKQIVDNCDMAVAVFWTRLGTPTDEAESGTAEEIARMGKAGKPVMLYFSDAEVRLRSVNLAEYQRLVEFQEQTYPKGLIESYNSLEEFRDKFRRQLAIQIRNIISTDSREQSESVVDGHGITLAFAQAHPPALLSPPNIIELSEIICTNEDDIPDYTDDSNEPVAVSGNMAMYVSASPNRQFYREVVAYTERIALRRQLLLAMYSTSDRSMRDIHLDIKVETHSSQLLINPPALSWPSSRLQYTSASFSSWPTYQQPPMEVPGLVKVQGISEYEWRMEADIPVIQARRTVYLTGFFTVTATEDSVAIFDATVYSSDALPFALCTELEIRVKSQEMSYQEILREMIQGYDEGSR